VDDACVKNEETAMQLPFTNEQFFDLFAAYNTALWPAVIALWTASAVMSARLLVSSSCRDRSISALLALHWAWSALAYHVAFFTRINPAAWLFAVLFLIQAALFLWFGVVRRRLSFSRQAQGWAPIAWSLVAYALLYPGINALQHLSLSRIPAFAVPCPTTIFTAGMLMLARPRFVRLSVVPVLWAAVGGSAASALGVTADYALPVAGILLAVFTVTPQNTRTPQLDGGGLHRASGLEQADGQRDTTSVH